MHCIDSHRSRRLPSSVTPYGIIATPNEALITVPTGYLQPYEVFIFWEALSDKPMK